MHQHRVPLRHINPISPVSSSLYGGCRTTLSTQALYRYQGHKAYKALLDHAPVSWCRFFIRAVGSNRLPN